MRWSLHLFLFFSLFLLSSSTSVCKTEQCVEASKFLLGTRSKTTDACTDHYVHSCTSEERKKFDKEQKLRKNALREKDRMIVLEKIRASKDLNDTLSIGIAKLNESCMSFKGSLVDLMEQDLNDMHSTMSFEQVAAFTARGQPIFFRHKFNADMRGLPPTFTFRNIEYGLIADAVHLNRQRRANNTEGFPTKEEQCDKFYKKRRSLLKDIELEDIKNSYDFEDKFLKFRPKERDYRYNLDVVYKYDDFVRAFSTPNWNMSRYLEGIANRKSLEEIIVEDPFGIRYAVKILSETNVDVLKKYIKISYLQKTSTFFFMKKKFPDFPNPNATESTQQEDCLSLVIRFFPFLLMDVRRETTDPVFFDWAEQATIAVKKAFYRQIDDSDWLEPFEKIVLLDIIRKMKVYVYDDRTLYDDDIEYPALAQAMSNTSLLANLKEFEGSPVARIMYSLEHSAYTQVKTREVFLQLMDKESDLYYTIPQIGLARIITILGHEFGHHFVDHYDILHSARGPSDGFRRHLRNTLDCYRKETDESISGSSIFGHLSEVNTQKVLREVSGDIMAVQIGAEAFSYLDVELLPNINTKEELFYLAATTSDFYCFRRPREDQFAFFEGTHPIHAQRIEYGRVFDRTSDFERTFNCTRKKAVCPYVY